MHQEELDMLRDSARDLIAERSPVSSLRTIRDSSDERGYDPEFWKQACELGWSGILVPAESGGSGMGMAGAGILAREMGRQLVLSPFISTSVMAVTAMAAAGRQGGDWLARIASGEVSVAVAVEHLVSPEAGTLKAVPGNSGGYRLAGVLHDVADGQIADAILVAASVEGKAQEPLLFLVDAAAAGLVRATRKLVDGRRVGDLRFDAVDAGSPLRAEDSASLVERVLDAGRACVAARLCGTAEAAFERTLEFLKERVQFGRRIGSFQALQHRAAHMHCQIEDAWSASLKALRAVDADAPDRGFAVAVAKAKASDVACRVTAECLQLHGGVGMTDEFDIGLYLKHARVDAELLGSYTFHADRVARHLGY